MKFGHFELAQTDAGWLARYVTRAGSREYEWATRPFPTRRRALVAIFALTGQRVQPSNGFPPGWSAHVQAPTHIAEVRDVDERSNAPHGSASTYTNRGCRCDPCKQARAEYMDSGLPDGEAS